MSSINPGMGPPPIASSLAGLSPSEKNNTSEKASRADAAASKTVESANAEQSGLKESEKPQDRDADGRQLYESDEEPMPQDSTSDEEQAPQCRPRSQDPNRNRGNSLDLDA